MPLTAGTKVGSYEIVALLGSGGMGEVWRARDTRLGRDVALKLLPDAFARDRERLARFEREARTVAGLTHPNIVTLHSIEEVEGIRFLTMELVEGRSLDREIVTGGLPVARLLDIAVAMSDALVAAHEKGVVHRDLKPANVMMTRDGRVKVLDFGLARPAWTESSPGSATQARTVESPISSLGQMVGTAPYMAPEQVRGEAVDARTDLFALGVMIYEMAAGHRPFTGATLADVSSSILRDAPAPLASLRSDLPADLQRIVERCLEKSPGARFRTAIDLRNELRSLQRMLERGAPAASRPPGKEVPSIAVLPFMNMSREEENEYFSDGLAEELLNVLTKIRGLRVAARSSAFAFRGKAVAVAEVGRTLNVSTVLEGSVRKAGNRVRIAVQLIKVSDGFHLWSETYDRTLDDIFAVQDDIAQSVVKELRSTLFGKEADSEVSGEARAEVVAAVGGRGQNPEAHRLYLQGRYFIDRFTSADVTRGIGYLKEALALEPEHALAWAQLSNAYANQASYGWAPFGEGFEQAREAGRRAMELAPDLAEAHAALCRVQSSYDLDFKRAYESCRRAVDLAPGNAEVLLIAAVISQQIGRVDEAITLLRRALEQDPLSSTIHIRLGSLCRVSGRPDESLTACRQALDLAPQRIVAHLMMSLALIAQGRNEEALAEAQLEPAPWARLTGIAAAHDAAGRRAESDDALRELEEKFADQAAFQIACVYGGRGDRDAAFTWLDRAFEQRDPGITFSLTETAFSPIHGDPRWPQFLSRIGLGDYGSVAP